jgi:molybdopterin/thiamine biosynthesis adenylyltransferase
MEYSLALTQHDMEILEGHLLGDRSCEQLAVTLCGVNRLHHELRLLVRTVILLPPNAFRHQSGAHLELKPEVQAFIHQLAADRGLIQVDWHSHPGNHASVSFSGVDDEYEALQAVYLAHRMDGVPYGSIVVNDRGLEARLWITKPVGRARSKNPQREVTYRPQAYPLKALYTGDLQRRIPVSAQRARRGAPFVSPLYDRQVRAFGRALQHKLQGVRVGIVGVGAIGGSLVEYLSRLGFREWVLVDPDVVELSNLNRLVNASVSDAQRRRSKVYVARSTLRQVAPKAYVRALQADVFDPEAQRALKGCDLLVVATDNHSSRMAVNRLAVQYLIPLVHLGFHIGVEEGERGEPRVTDVSGEFALPDLGRWCLQCAGIVDAQQAGWELASPEQRALLRQRGYVTDTPAPAVHHLDGLVAALAAAEIHNLVHAFKPRQRYLVYDALKSELLPLQVTPSDACPVCSAEHGVLGLGDLEPLPDYRRSAAVQLPTARESQPEQEDSRHAADDAKHAPRHAVTPLPRVQTEEQRHVRALRMHAAMVEDDLPLD